MVQIIKSNGGGGGGGGASYTAGTGIEISAQNEISVDTDVVQTVGNMVDNLTGADDDHYPTAKAVADAISGGGLGDVIGPASSTDGDVALFDGATGKLIKDSGVNLSSKLDASALSDNNYGGAWENDSTHTPTKRALYDKIHTMDVEIGNKAADNTVVKLTGNQTINGTKTFGTSPVVPSKTADATNTGTAIATEAQVYNVEQKIPSVIDDLTSTSSTSALSANQGKVLDDKISSLFGLGKFLSTWDATTGQPDSFPLATPYTYTTGDYYLVSTISSATPPVNYKPSGSSYTGTASSATESEELAVGDIYIYDGTNWLLQLNHGKTVSFSEIAGNATDNTSLSNALATKADDNAVVKLTGDQTIAGTKTFSTSPVVPSKTTDATNTGTAIATEAQVYKKQDALATQTVYTTQGGATKVPQISTNNLGQVTNITEVTITQPDISGLVTGPASSTDGHLAVFDGATGKIVKDGGAVPTGVPAVGNNGQVLTVVSGAAAWVDPTGTDYSWVTKTISGGEVELGIRTIVNIPTSNFTLTAPATLAEGEEYVIRIISEDNYTMTLGTGFTNPRNVNLSLSSYATDQFVFLAIGGELELQPLVATGS